MPLLGMFRQFICLVILNFQVVSCAHTFDVQNFSKLKWHSKFPFNNNQPSLDNLLFVLPFRWL